MLILKLFRVFELQWNYWTIFFSICPIPKRNSLWLIISKGYQILVIHRKIKASYTIWMRVQESSDWYSWIRIPHNKHWIISTIRSHNPPFIIWASSCSNLIAMALQKLLRLVSVVIENSWMSSSVKYLRSVFSCKVVYSLINVFIETNNPLQIQSCYSVSFLLILHILFVILIHFWILFLNYIIYYNLYYFKF